MSSLAGRVAVVTGGGQGIGAACARALAKAGASVVITARSRDRIERLASELTAQGHAARALVCDVTDETSVLALGREAAKFGPVDVLVNNAGAAASAPLGKTTLEEWNHLLAVNATGAFLCTRTFLPGMVDRHWGRVVNMASTAGLEGARYISAYSAAKHALVGFTRSVAAEVASSGVTVNAVCPGYVDTEMTGATLDRIVARSGRSRKEALDAVLAATDQPRLITAEEVAVAVTGLCDDAASGCNGEAIVLDGRDATASRFAIINPPSLGEPRGWNNGLLTRPGGRLLFVAGQTARDATGKVAKGDFVEQFDRALGNVLAVVREAGGSPEDIGRFTIYVTDVSRYRENLKPLGEVYRRHMGRHYPAMALVEVQALVDKGAEIEIEATAVVGDNR